MNKIEYLEKKCLLYKTTLDNVLRQIPNGAKLWQHRMYQEVFKMNKELRALKDSFKDQNDS